MVEPHHEKNATEGIAEDREPIPRFSYMPKTALGRRLWEIRERIIASGEPLLGWERIEREVAERGG